MWYITTLDDVGVYFQLCGSICVLYSNFGDRSVWILTLRSNCGTFQFWLINLWFIPNLEIYVVSISTLGIEMCPFQLWESRCVHANFENRGVVHYNFGRYKCVFSYFDTILWTIPNLVDRSVTILTLRSKFGPFLILYDRV